MTSRISAGLVLLLALAGCSETGDSSKSKPKGSAESLSAAQVYRDLGKSIESGATKGSRQGAIGWHAVAIAMQEAAPGSEATLKVWVTRASDNALAISNAYRAGREPSEDSTRGFGNALSEIDMLCA